VIHALALLAALASPSPAPTPIATPWHQGAYPTPVPSDLLTLQQSVYLQDAIIHALLKPYCAAYGGLVRYDLPPLAVPTTAYPLTLHCVSATLQLSQPGKATTP
jgi:hypothetical protein